MTRTLSPNLYKAVKAAYFTGSELKDVKTLPVLHHYHLRTHEGRLEITGTNLAEARQEYAPARVEQEFDFCVPMRPFKDWLSVTAKYKTILELSYDPASRILTVTECAPAHEKAVCLSRTQFRCMSADEFPTAAPTALV